MKNIILIKSFPNYQIAHLYEHIVLRFVNEYMYSKGMFKFVDYHAEGTTYEKGGLIVLDCLLYNNKAQNLEQYFTDIRIKLDKNNSQATTAFLQIAAEEDNKIIIDNPTEIVNALTKIDEQAWISIDDLTYIDTDKIRNSTQYIYETNTLNKDRKKMYLNFMLNSTFIKNNRNLLPLYYFISHIFSYTVCDKIAYTYGAYHASEININPKNYTSSTFLWLKPEAAEKVVMSEAMKLIGDTINYAQNMGALQRLCDELSTIRYDDMKSIPPNFDKVLSFTNIAIGSRGWQSIATKENIDLLLNNMEVEFKFKQQSAKHRIK